jgi:hypothetical protein
LAHRECKLFAAGGASEDFPPCHAHA